MTKENDDLTEKQSEIVRLLARGNAPKAVALLAQVSEKHVYNTQRNPKVIAVVEREMRDTLSLRIAPRAIAFLYGLFENDTESGNAGTISGNNDTKSVRTHTKSVSSAPKSARTGTKSTATIRERIDASRLILGLAGYVPPRATDLNANDSQKQLGDMSTDELKATVDRLEAELGDRAEPVEPLSVASDDDLSDMM